jgi:hypothetical protein
MNNSSNLKIVKRSLDQYAPSIFWTINGLLILCLFLLNKIHLNSILLVFLIASPVHLFVFILMLIRPLIKLDSTNLIVHPGIFKKYVIPIDSIKRVRFYEMINKTILTQKQQKENNTLIIDLIDGKEQSIGLLLTKSVRQKIQQFLSNNNIQSEYIASNKT